MLLRGVIRRAALGVASILVVSGTVVSQQTASAGAVEWSPQAGISEISSGDNHSCAISAGKVYCWGGGPDVSGSGFYSNIGSAHPVDTTGIMKDKVATKIASGMNHTCALADNDIYCWGANNQGQLGNNTTTTSLSPVQVDKTGILAGKIISDIAAGGAYSCAIADAKAYCWGYNSVRQLGNDIASYSSVPTTVDTSGVLANKSITDISAGNGTTCVVAESKPYCWGGLYAGELGNGSYDSSSLPVAVDMNGVLAGKEVTTIETKWNHTCVIASGQVYCWGGDTAGQLGNGAQDGNSTALTPVAVSVSGALAGKTISDVKVSFRSTCALAGGEVFCWGANNFGQLGNDSLVNSEYPIKISNGQAGSQYNYTTLSSGQNFHCAGGTQGVFCWGINSLSQLGANTIDYDPMPSTPTRVLSSILSIEFASPSRIEVSENGTEVYISGHGFQYGVKVLVDGIPVEILHEDGYIYSDRQLTIRIPAINDPKVSTLSIVNPDGMSVNFDTGIEFFKRQITAVEPYTENGEKRLKVTGDDFFKENQGTLDGLTRSLVTLNGIPLKMCAQGTLLQILQSLGDVYAEYYTDSVPCYDALSYDDLSPTMTSSEVILRLPQSFDLSAPGNVSVYDTPVFLYNSDGEVEHRPATALIDGLRPETSPIVSSRPTISGKALPGSTVLVTIHSDPVYCSATTNESGIWSCRPDQDLADGIHTLTIVITNPDGSVERIGPYSITVKSGNIIPFAPNAGVGRADSGPGYLIAVGLVCFAAIARGLKLKYRQA